MLKQINISELVPAETLVLLSPALARQAAEDIADQAKAQWIVLARQTLRRTYKNYVNSIGAVEERVVGDLSVFTITLLGEFPNMIENGWAPYDMRDTLLGPSVPVVPVGSGQKGKHETADGHFYRSIPFRVMGPTAGGTNAPNITEMYAKRLGKVRAATLGKQVWRVAKKLEASTKQPGQATKWGDRLAPGTAGVGKLEKHHATDIFAGMYRMTQRAGQETGGSFGTFRTISTAPHHQNSWMNKGNKGVHLHKKVVDYVREIAGATIQGIVEGSGG